MKNHVVIVVSAAVLSGLTTGSSPAWSQLPEDCTGLDAPLCEDEKITTITYELVPFVDANIENGKVRGVDCDPTFQVVVDRIITVTIAGSDTRYYAGSFCFDNGSLPGDTTITTQDVMELVDLPPVDVHHNPHHDLLVNIDTWFWHEGPTSHTQTVTLPVDASTTLTGTYTGQVVTWCWTVDDPRGPLPSPEVGGTVCDQPPGASTYLAQQPGEDSPSGAAATHVFDRHGDTTITHEVLWSGSLTITAGPGVMVGRTLELQSTAVRSSVTLPVRQIVPVPVPNSR